MTGQVPNLAGHYPQALIKAKAARRTALLRQQTQWLYCLKKSNEDEYDVDDVDDDDDDDDWTSMIMFCQRSCLSACGLLCYCCNYRSRDDAMLSVVIAVVSVGTVPSIMFLS